MNLPIHPHIPSVVIHPSAAPTPRVARAVERNQAAVPELFADRALSVTRGHRETEGQPLAVRRARMLQRVLEDHPIVIQEGELIVGTKTRKPRGSPVFPEI
ncbi:MAG: pyruvate formate lyase family protein, partial [Bacteroidales bacterium]